MLKSLSLLPPQTRHLLNGFVTIASALLCLLILPTRFPGMELLGISANWTLIWVVAWSVKRTAFQGAIAGLVLGLIQDGMTSPHPTHALGLAVIGMITGRFQKQRYIQEDFISVALIVFGMAVLAETAIALQLSWDVLRDGDRSLLELWTDHQRIALCSAILSSLWAPVIYFPLNQWWEQVRRLDQ